MSTTEEILRDFYATEEPWRLEGKSVAQWIAERDELFPERLEASEPYQYRGLRMKNPPPSASGIYFLCADDILYIGKAHDLGFRISTHFIQRRIPFRFACWILCPKAATAWLEAYWIDLHKPPYNRRWDGPMQRMRDEVAEALGE